MSASTSTPIAFHLSYTPAATTAEADGASASKSTNDDMIYRNPTVAIRRSSSIRLYHCRSQHDSDGGFNEDGGGPFCTDNSSGNAHATISEQQCGDDCDCCCCLSERCVLDSLPISSSLNSSQLQGSSFLIPGQNRTVDTKCNIKNTLRGPNVMLAVLVPPSLTRDLVNLASSARAASGAVESNGYEMKLEKELRRSIHPCLCVDSGPHSAIHFGVKSDGDCGKSRIPEKKLVEEESSSTLSYPQLSVCGIITSSYSSCANFPADVVLLAPSSPSSAASLGHHERNLDGLRGSISHYSDLLNHETASNAPGSVIKAFPVSTISILPITGGATGDDVTISTTSKVSNIAALPCCPVCLNLIEPTHLGLPELKPVHKCSQWCLSANDFDSRQSRSKHHPCANEMKFLPWPPPSECIACHQRARYVDSGAHCQKRISSIGSSLLSSPGVSREHIRGNSLALTGNRISTPISSALTQDATQPPINRHPRPQTCHQCAMSTTLWVCLTCGVVGCGRYTLKHAAEHYMTSKHPFSLELATGRIWDYEHGIFVHRRDLVECPVLSRMWGIAVASIDGLISSSSLGNSAPSSGIGFQARENNLFRDSDNASIQRVHMSGNGHDRASCNDNRNQQVSAASCKLSSQPKKSIMISQEYEALLQSALEDQTHYFEGEISRLRAQMASSHVHEAQISDRESREIQALQNDSNRLRKDAEQLSSALLDAQKREAKHRSVSQRLLREQSVAKELLEKLRKETLAEHELAKQSMEELELQIVDLTANLQMMSQFAENEELSQAQIFGTMGGEKAGKQRGKKGRRGRKKG